jgi:hypothetical protein
MTIKCYWLEPTDRARVSLRRYAGIREGEAPCLDGKARGLHNAEVAIGEEDAEVNAAGRRHGKRDDETLHNDPRWPKVCACGYEFADSDPWQTAHELLYRRLDTGATMTLHEATPGAMYDAWWYMHDGRQKRNAHDSVFLVVVCPSSKYGKAEWMVDGSATNGPGWDRTGVANSANPTVTASPSIVIGEGNSEYHGWLRNGQLVDA